MASQPESRGLLNSEDEPLIGAVLGQAMGLMRHPPFLELKGFDYDPHQTRRRIDEAERAIRWQRIAPAFAVGSTPFQASDEILTDTYRFRRGDSWGAWMTGRTVMQAAPARVSHNMPLPEVAADGEVPYVISGRYPNGAVAVVTLPRMDAERGPYLPKVRVTLHAVDFRHPIGIFGEYALLVLRGSGSPVVRASTRKT